MKASKQGQVKASAQEPICLSLAGVGWQQPSMGMEVSFPEAGTRSGVTCMQLREHCVYPSVADGEKMISSVPSGNSTLLRSEPAAIMTCAQLCSSALSSTPLSQLCAAEDRR